MDSGEHARAEDVLYESVTVGTTAEAPVAKIEGLLGLAWLIGYEGRNAPGGLRLTEQTAAEVVAVGGDLRLKPSAGESEAPL